MTLIKMATSIKDISFEWGLYKQKEVKSIKLFFIYINENNEIYTIKNEAEMLVNSEISKERLIYLIKNNHYNLLNKHKLVSILQYNIDLDHLNLSAFILDKIQPDYLTSLKIVDNIIFKNTISFLEDQNSIFFIYNSINNTNNTNNTNKMNTTKKIILTGPNKSKTRKK
jgi:hypothetical protein